MRAVIKTGGKQYLVSPGETFKVERIPGEVGDKVTLTDVLLISEGQQVKLPSIAAPLGRVEAEIVGQGKMKKILIFKKRRRKTYRRTRGHRQPFTVLKVNTIETAQS